MVLCVGTRGGKSAHSGPTALEAPGCHLTICGELAALGKD